MAAMDGVKSQGLEGLAAMLARQQEKVSVLLPPNALAAPELRHLNMLHWGVLALVAIAVRG